MRGQRTTGSWSHDYQSLSPFLPQIPCDNHNPEQSVKAGWPRCRISPLECQKLLAQGQILEQKIPSGVEETPKQAVQEPKHGKLISDACPTLIVETVDIAADPNFAEARVISWRWNDLQGIEIVTKLIDPYVLTEPRKVLQNTPNKVSTFFYVHQFLGTALGLIDRTAPATRDNRRGASSLEGVSLVLGLTR